MTCTLSRSVFFLAALTSLGACASTMSSVPVKGTDKDLSRLTGQWEGTYESTASGREGTIAFSLAVGRHTAEGKVTMTVAAGDVRPLQIEFLAIDEAGSVNGKLEPYVDPACNCNVETEFTGELRGGMIDGTFVTHRAGESDG